MAEHFLNIIKLFGFYIFIVILQILYIIYKKRNVDNSVDLDVDFNIKNVTKIDEFIKKTVKERIELLTSGKLSYQEWIDYNNKNNSFAFDKDHTYYIFLYEVEKDNRTVITRVHINKQYINLEWSNILNDQQNNLLFVKQTTDPDLILHMYDMGSYTIPNKIAYFWTEYNTITGKNQTILKNSIIYKWDGKKIDKTGVIGMGYAVEDLSSTNIFYYYDYIHYLYVIVISILTFAVTLVLYKLNTRNNSISSILKPLGFLLVTNMYILYFLHSNEFIGSSEIEKSKITDINSGILSVSFLVGVNTFIITSLKRSLKKNLFIESGLIFGVSLILLLFSAFKITNFSTIAELVQDRISNQLVFNFSIILNIFVIVNYIIHVLTDKHV